MKVTLVGNKKNLVTTEVSRTSVRKIKLLLLNEHERQLPVGQSKLKKTILLFAGGEWHVPKELVAPMYKEIVLAFSRLDCLHETKKGKRLP